MVVDWHDMQKTRIMIRQSRQASRQAGQSVRFAGGAGNCMVMRPSILQQQLSSSNIPLRNHCLSSAFLHIASRGRRSGGLRWREDRIVHGEAGRLQPGILLSMKNTPAIVLNRKCRAIWVRDSLVALHGGHGGGSCCKARLIQKQPLPTGKSIRFKEK